MAPDYVTQSEADVSLFVNDINEGAVLQSDVRTGDDSNTVESDNVDVSFANRSKNPNVTTVQVARAIDIDRYTVRYFRSDGRNTQGVDVPYSITGDLRTTLDLGDNATVSIQVVRAQAKLDAPLTNLRGIVPGAWGVVPHLELLRRDDLLRPHHVRAGRPGFGHRPDRLRRLSGASHGEARGRHEHATANPAAAAPPGSTRLALALALLTGGCGLDEVKIPDPSGPSELGLALKLTVSPDVLTADGFSTSLVQVQAFDQNGGAAAGRTVLLAIIESGGNFVDLGTPQRHQRHAAASGRGHGGDQQRRGGHGRVHRARPHRLHRGRLHHHRRPAGRERRHRHRLPLGEDRAAVGRAQALPAGHWRAPSCNFVVEAPQGSTTCSDAKTCTVKVNTSVLFQDTSVDSDGFIVRYDWYWGDGSPNEDSPDSNHVFRSAGSFTVTHRVTDNTRAGGRLHGHHHGQLVDGRTRGRPMEAGPRSASRTPARVLP